MERLAPAGDVYQAGTLSGNPLAMAAGLATLALLRAPGAYDRLEATVGGARGGAARGPGVTVNRVGAMLTAFFHPGPVRSLRRRRRERHRPLRRASTRTCSPAACTSRRRSSRR